MKYILVLTLIISILVPIQITADDIGKLPIISREQWGADETYTYRNSSYWQAIIKKRQETSENAPDIPEEEKQKARDIYKQKIDYINENFSDQYTVTETITHEGDEQLAWPIKKSDYVRAILVHHTDGEYEDSFEGIRDIYRFHSLGRQWGDIGYNYIIGYNGEIFEGRKGGDYTVGAHAKWNNISTVGISVLGNYHEKPINSLQYTSLERLIQELAIKYGIDLSKNYYYNMDCSGAACNVFPLETHLHNTLSGHRHAGHTHCPGDELYHQMEQIRLDNIDLTAGLTPVKRPAAESENGTISTDSGRSQKIVKVLKTLSNKKLEQLIQMLESRIEIEQNNTISEKLRIIKVIAQTVVQD